MYAVLVRTVTIEGMCDSLYTVDGIELSSVGDARRYGIPIPERFLAGPRTGDRCFCGIDLDEILAKHASNWKEGRFWVFGRYAELDADGRTWFDGYDIETSDPRYPDQRTISRSDGRKEMTLDQWEAARERHDAETGRR